MEDFIEVPCSGDTVFINIAQIAFISCKRITMINGKVLFPNISYSEIKQKIQYERRKK